MATRSSSRNSWARTTTTGSSQPAVAEILLVRHGQTDWSRDGRHTGRTDVPLTEEGRGQAERLAGVLSGRDFARVLTSPLSRASETCRLAGLGERAETRDELVEWDYGDFEGLTTEQIRERRPGWWLWRDGCPGGEAAADVGARVDPVVGELHGLEDDAILFAHGHVLRVLAARWVGLEPERGALLRLETAALSALGWEREQPVITLWNEQAA
jgi:broad specificity phosphatase PhoE